jgi:hypothetical protein
MDTPSSGMMPQSGVQEDPGAEDEGYVNSRAKVLAHAAGEQLVAADEDLTAGTRE